MPVFCLLYSVFYKFYLYHIWLRVVRQVNFGNILYFILLDELRVQLAPWGLVAHAVLINKKERYGYEQPETKISYFVITRV